MENTVLLSTVFRVYPKSRILDFSDVVLNCTHRSEKGLQYAIFDLVWVVKKKKKKKKK